MSVTDPERQLAAADGSTAAGPPGAGPPGAEPTGAGPAGAEPTGAGPSGAEPSGAAPGRRRPDLARLMDSGVGRNLGLVAVLAVLCVIGVATADTF
ncbi:MAG: hypothetical protein QOK26_2344, partial [Pseudonocardiales bacterium]|nr:hypothetical protein [Pseudonocardiales bacterium]